MRTGVNYEPQKNSDVAVHIYSDNKYFFSHAIEFAVDGELDDNHPFLEVETQIPTM